MMRLAVRTVIGLGLAAALLLGAWWALINFPQPLFPHHVEAGRLALYSDTPFDEAKGRALLADIEARLETSPLDDHQHHGIYVTNTGWRRGLIFVFATGAAAANYNPLTASVFIREADIDTGVVVNAAGVRVAAPRTLAYYAAHEITHSFTANHLGAGKLWNKQLPQWVREGYADYVGFGGRVDADELRRRCAAGDPELDFAKSHAYARFRMLAAWMMDRKGLSIDQLLALRTSVDDALAEMNASPGPACR